MVQNITVAKNSEIPISVNCCAGNKTLGLQFDFRLARSVWSILSIYTCIHLSNPMGRLREQWFIWIMATQLSVALLPSVYLLFYRSFSSGLVSTKHLVHYILLPNANINPLYSDIALILMIPQKTHWTLTFTVQYVHSHNQLLCYQQSMRIITKNKNILSIFYIYSLSDSLNLFQVTKSSPG